MSLGERCDNGILLFPDNLHTYSLKSLHSTFTRYIKVYINYQKISIQFIRYFKAAHDSYNKTAI